MLLKIPGAAKVTWVTKAAFHSRNSIGYQCQISELKESNSEGSLSFYWWSLGMVSSQVFCFSGWPSLNSWRAYL